MRFPRIRGDLVILAALLGGSAYAIATQIGTDPVGEVRPARPPALRIGDRFPGFRLADVAGVSRTLDEWKGSKATVLYFWMVECPCVDQIAMRVQDLIDRWPDEKGEVRFIAVDSDPSDTPKQVLGKMVDVRAAYRLVLDSKQEVAARLGAPAAVTFVVLDGENRVRFRGTMDDDLLKPTKPHLAQAIEALLEGKNPPVTETDPLTYGCPFPGFEGECQLKAAD